MSLPVETALVVVDVQVGFDDPWWGPRNNPACDANVEALVAAFVRAGRPLVFVRHDSSDPASPLHASRAGNALKPYLAGYRPDLMVVKSVNSSFHGAPDLDAWLRAHDITTIVVTGITTNHCCETTSRVGGNLGFDVRFVLDATHTFDRSGPGGDTMTADELARATATNLHGEFATVVTTADVLHELGASAGAEATSQDSPAAR